MQVKHSTYAKLGLMRGKESSKIKPFFASLWHNLEPMNHLRSGTLLLALLLLFTQGGFAQTKISAQIRGLKQPKAYLGAYRTAAPVLIDSVAIDTGSGVINFQLAKTLEPGMYFLDFRKGLGFQFMINGESALHFQSIAKSLVDSLQAGDSKENELFFYYQQYLGRKSVELENLQFQLDLMRRATKDPKEIQPLIQKQQQISQSIAKFTKDMVEQNKGTLFSELFGMRQVVQPPASIPSMAQGRVNPTYLQYIRDHYWDAYNFRDERLWRNIPIRSFAAWTACWAPPRSIHHTII
jgi:hypothetical protein